MVIVTQNQYILASKIHHVTLDENIEHNNYYDNKGRNRTHINKTYTLTVVYCPEDHNNQNNNNGLKHNPNDVRECQVVLRGALNAHMVFKNLIQQIREQMPDQLYLDKALENMLNGMDLKAIEEKDANLDLEIRNDRSAEKIRSPRKAKRRSKKVLRRAKRSGRSR